MPHGQTHVRTLPPRHDLASGARALADALNAAATRRGGDLARAGYVRIEQPLREADPVGWLRTQAPLARFFWGTRDEGFSLAGAGISEEVEGADFEGVAGLIDRFASGEAGVRGRAFVTARFDLGAAPVETWSAYRRVYVQVPLLELRRAEGEHVLAVNLRAGEALRSGAYDAQRRTAMRTVARVAPAPKAVASARARPAADASAQAAWHAQVARVLAAIEAGELRKAVLARRRTLEGGSPVDALALLDALCAGQSDTFRFLVQPSPHTAFLGASPERLYRRRGLDLRTEALAGTRARGDAPAADAQLAEALRRSEKDRREHDLVRQHVDARLRPLCETLASAPGPEVRTMRHVHHLHTGFEGRLRAGARDADVLAALHPTPAVCGTPTDAALGLLRELEGFDRGLFGGAVGCFGRDEVDCAVAIRSALVSGNTVQLFAGAGIVAGSDADAEWEETAVKMKPLAELLGAVDVA
jgi:menaquinone-specific isochorismate synthase